MYTKSPLCNTSSVTLLGRLLLFNAKPEAPQAILGRQTTLGSPIRRQLHPHTGLAVHAEAGRAGSAVLPTRHGQRGLGRRPWVGLHNLPQVLPQTP